MGKPATTPAASADAKKKGAALYVYSTLTSDQRYTNYRKGENDLPAEVGSVFIKGGAGVANDRLVTPRGVVTAITEDDLKILEANDDFKLHKKNGFVEVSQSLTDADEVAAEMGGYDLSTPLTGATAPGAKVGGISTDGSPGTAGGFALNQ